MTRSPDRHPRHPRRARRLLVLALVGALAAVLPAPVAATAPRTAVASVDEPRAAAGPITPAAFSAAAVDLTFTKVAGGLSKPILVTHAGDGSGRLFIVEQVGRIKIVKNGSVLATPFLDIRSAVSKGGEQGLLGLAFHPDYETNGRFFVNYTNTSGDTVIRMYKRSSSNPDRATTTGNRTILRIDQPYSNHNGGHLAFGRDGYLYIGMGDGGSSGDPGNRAQNVNSLLGKMLRINVNRTTSTRNYVNPSTNPWVGRTGRDEIWSRGLRNPWRWSFDRATGDLWIGDVGQNRYEEVDRSKRVSAGAGRGVNYGWRVMEGRHCYRPSSGCSTSGKVMPIVEYSHGTTGRCAVTGGYVYRGSASPVMVGGYFFGDYCTGEIWAISATASSPASRTLLRNTDYLVSSFGEDEDGELYLTDLNGSVFRISGS